MLTVLRVADFAIVDQAELVLGAGLTAITGETGAGKSLLVGALELLVGGRSSAKVVRAGAATAEIQAQFDDVTSPVVLAALAERGLATDDGSVVVRRVIARGGGGRSYLCGRLVTAADLRAVIGPMVDLCGQHQHSRLLAPDHHLTLVDRFGDLGELRATYHQLWARQKAALAELQDLQATARVREERLDYLKFCADELDRAAVEPGEFARADAEARRLHGASDLLATTQRASAVLLDDGGVRDRVAPLAGELGELVAIDAKLAPMARQADDLVALVDELAADLERYADAVDVDVGRRGELDERLAELHRLARKYGGSEAAMLQRQAAIEAELSGQQHEDTRLAKLRADVPNLVSAAQQAADKLGAARRAAAPALVQATATVLDALAMGQAELSVEFTAEDKLVPHGGERARLLLASNVGEPAQPLAAIASGGELSRLLLALERACAPSDGHVTAIFDEVDAGVGGDTGDRLGAFLAEMGRDQQVLCITHLPQVAARADRQLHVEKHTREGRTVSTVRPLGTEERVTELARMLGAATAATATSHARSLLLAR